MNCLDESNPDTKPPEPTPSTLPTLPPGLTWADPDPGGPSFRAPNGVVCCCASVAQAVAMARRWAVGR